MNKGESWQAISPDLTKDLPQGNVPYSTISVLEESPHQFGILYAGTDDGNLQLTKDGGATWQLINSGLPQNLWVSSIEISHHRPERVYVTFTGYRQDDFKAYLYRSDDYGKTWQSVKGNLPEEAVNVLREDLENENLLFVGTDHGTYVSFDGGTNWQSFNQIPNVASYDMIIHPKANELVIGTHGRSVYVADLEPIRAMLKAGEQSVSLSAPNNVRFRENWGERPYPYLSKQEPEIVISYFLPDKATATLTIANAEGGVVYQGALPEQRGFNQFTWNGAMNRNGAKGKRNKATEAGYLTTGKYKVTVNQGGKSASQELVVQGKNE
jgi:hypothetical protein